MCAFQNSPSLSKKRTSASEALSNNSHSHPVLKHLSDEHLSSGQGSSRNSSASPARRASPFQAPASASTGWAASSSSPGRLPISSNTDPSSPYEGSLKRTESPHFTSSALANGDGTGQSIDIGDGTATGNEDDRQLNRQHQRRAHPHYNKYAPRGMNGHANDSFDHDYIAGTATPPRYHDLSHTNTSVQDLGALERLVDDRAGQHEGKRASEEFLAEVSKRKNGSAIRAYYERLNVVLDGWREVDEILDSHFPQEVMMRFGTVEEVERSSGSRRRLPWVHKRHLAHKRKKAYSENDEDGDNDSGYQEESESDHEEDRNPPSRRRQSQLARVANAAFSGFWFGTPTKVKIKRRDEETGLLEPPPTPSTSGAPSASGPGSYGSTSRQQSSAHGKLPTIKDEDSRQGSSVMVDELSKVSAEEGSQSVGPSTSNRQRADGQPAALQDYFDNTDGSTNDTDAPLVTKKLERRLEEERKGRDRRRTGSPTFVGLPARNQKSSERSPSVGPAGKSQPGGVSERNRKKLLKHVPGREEREGERERGTNFAININLAANVLLLAGKIVAVLSSNSVSLIASLVDSALDLLSTIIIFGTSKAISYRSFHTYFKYPVGKKRFEPLGVVIFAVLMIASFCQVLVESVERLYAVFKTGREAPGEASELPLVGIAFMVLTIVIKLFMWIIYRKSSSSGVRAVAQDAENDVVFNVASLIFPAVGSKLGWPALDPIGGICLSIYIITEWLDTLTETVSKLTGAVGSPQDISRALYLVLRFRSVNGVSAFELYHAGDDMIVEADVVLPHSLALKEAHDLGEIITYCMEGVAQIERAYIHLDYNPLGQAGHITGRG